MIWSCPICKQALHSHEKSVRCISGHSFDRARQGYLNLLPVQYKRSRAPGDDRNMLLARRQFLQADHYKPLAQLLVEMVLARCRSGAEPLVCFDSGCGEGYYLNYLSEILKNQGCEFRGYGSDISREAVKLASSSYKEMQFAVASNFQLPVADSCVDLLLRIFAPGDSEEIARVLRPDGEFWRVVPGPRHLLELKRELYPQAKVHDLPGTPAGFETRQQQQLEYSIHLGDNSSVRQLLDMTPFSWQASNEKQRVLKATEALSVTVSFVVQCYGLKS